MPNKPNARHVSEWNNETYIINPCVYNEEKKTFEVLFAYPDVISGKGELTRECIELGEDNILEVCMTCHKGIMLYPYEEEDSISEKIEKILDKNNLLCSNKNCVVNTYFIE